MSAHRAKRDMVSRNVVHLILSTFFQAKIVFLDGTMSHRDSLLFSYDFLQTLNFIKRADTDWCIYSSFPLFQNMPDIKKSVSMLQTVQEHDISITRW